jgi:hypothetical protein
LPEDEMPIQYKAATAHIAREGANTAALPVL